MRIADLSEDKFHFQEHQKIENISADALDSSLKTGFTVGKSGTIPATAADTATAPAAVPFDMTVQFLKVVRVAHGSAATAVQPRLSTDDGNSYSNVLEVITFGATSFKQELTLATEVDLNEGEMFNFSVSSGGGETIVLYVLGKVR